MEKPAKIAPPKGRLGVLLPGMGAVSTTFMAGVELVRKGKAQPVGSLTQLGTIRLGKRTDNHSPRIKELVPLAELDDLVFGGWDLFKDTAYEAALHAGVLSKEDLANVKAFLSKIKPMKAAFDKEYVKKLDGTYVKKAKNKYELALQIKDDIANFRKTSRATRLVTCWCASTEVFIKPEDVHSTPEKFIEGMKKNHPAIAPSMLYAWASVTSGVPFANGDGEVLDDPGSFKTKEESKLGALEYILQPQLYPQLYGKIHHKVRINYYPPRGDNKEGWDNIDIFGWLNYPMQIKVDFLCRDSILAAPIVLDLILFLDLAKRTSELRGRGIQEWLSFYFKSPMTAPGLYPEHDLFIQSMKLKNTLRWMKGEDLITHLGQEYYD